MKNKFAIVLIIFIFFVSVFLVYTKKRSEPKSQSMNLMYLQQALVEDNSNNYGGAFLNESNELVVLVKEKNELNCSEIEQLAKTKDIIYQKCDYSLATINKRCI
ncbi:MAG: hypothetical protein KBA53_12185 [Thermoclostridium sp.]|nr:hypothetical protein [Thermoclostridium sp.]